MFTVIIATHDRPLLLARTLRSFAAQSYRDFTTIVVSDNPTATQPVQDLEALPGPYRVLLRNGEPGPAESRNLGMALTATDYAMFLDDDDTLAPSHLMSMANALNSQRPELLFCDFVIAKEDRRTWPPTPRETIPVTIHDVTRNSQYVRNRIPNSCLMYARPVLKSARFDSSLIVYEDWDFLLSCLTGRDLVHVPVNSVNIHKSYDAGAENRRRGNSHDDKIVETNLLLYKRYPAPDEESRRARQRFFAAAGMTLPIDSF